ncbi:MAG: hypothetical protein OHK0048_24690 [Rhodoferax sp.]
MQIRIALNTTPEQAQRLLALQAVFAQACTVLMAVVQQTRIWNRVALHHLAYKSLRAQFAAMGSQMACNAIYSVSRTCRALFQSPSSPFYLPARPGKPLPAVRFEASCPVYFDRHTLSLKAGQISMVTLDGRMRFALALDPEAEALFHTRKLREVVLRRCEAPGAAVPAFELVFTLDDADTPAGGGADAASQADVADATEADAALAASDIPEYLLIEEPADAPYPAPQ